MTASNGPLDLPPTPRRKERRTGMSVRIGPVTLFKGGLPRFDRQDPYAFAVALSWRDFALLFVAAELAINTIFALLFLADPRSIANHNPPGFLGAFFFSLETLATVGYGQMYPGTIYGHVISSVEILTGVIFTAIMTGLLFVRFSRPKAKIMYAADPIVTFYNGQPTLMLRIANARTSLLTNAIATIHTLALQVSTEGISARTTLEMRLVRRKMPIFAIMWTLMHVIDEQSPLYGIGPDNVEARDLRLFVTVTARDQFLGQEVSDIQAYEGADLRFGMRYADAIKVGEDGHVFADYAAISDMEPDVHGDTPADT